MKKNITTILFPLALILAFNTTSSAQISGFTTSKTFYAPGEDVNFDLSYTLDRGCELIILIQETTSWGNKEVGKFTLPAAPDGDFFSGKLTMTNAYEAGSGVRWQIYIQEIGGSWQDPIATPKFYPLTLASVAASAKIDSIIAPNPYKTGIANIIMVYYTSTVNVDIVAGFRENWIPKPTSKTSTLATPTGGFIKIELPILEAAIPDLPYDLDIYITSVGGGWSDRYFQQQYPVTFSEETTIAKVETNNKKAICYPNPFVNETNIEFNLSKPQQVSIMVYAIDGSLITPLCNQILPSGNQRISWNKANIKAGVYTIIIQSEDIIDTLRIIAQ